MHYIEGDVASSREERLQQRRLLRRWRPGHDPLDSTSSASASASVCSGSCSGSASAPTSRVANGVDVARGASGAEVDGEMSASHCGSLAGWLRSPVRGAAAAHREVAGAVEEWLASGAIATASADESSAGAACAFEAKLALGAAAVPSLPCIGTNAAGEGAWSAIDAWAAAAAEAVVSAQHVAESALEAAMPAAYAEEVAGDGVLVNSAPQDGVRSSSPSGQPQRYRASREGNSGTLGGKCPSSRGTAAAACCDEIGIQGKQGAGVERFLGCDASSSSSTAEGVESLDVTAPLAEAHSSDRRRSSLMGYDSPALARPSVTSASHTPIRPCFLFSQSPEVLPSDAIPSKAFVPQTRACSNHSYSSPSYSQQRLFATSPILEPATFERAGLGQHATPPVDLQSGSVAEANLPATSAIPALPVVPNAAAEENASVAVCGSPDKILLATSDQAQLVFSKDSVSKMLAAEGETLEVAECSAKATSFTSVELEVVQPVRATATLEAGTVIETRALQNSSTTISAGAGAALEAPAQTIGVATPDSPTPTAAEIEEVEPATTPGRDAAKLPNAEALLACGLFAVEDAKDIAEFERCARLLRVHGFRDVPSRLEVADEGGRPARLVADGQRLTAACLEVLAAFEDRGRRLRDAVLQERAEQRHHQDGAGRLERLRRENARLEEELRAIRASSCRSAEGGALVSGSDRVRELAEALQRLKATEAVARHRERELERLKARLEQVAADEARRQDRERTALARPLRRRGGTACGSDPGAEAAVAHQARAEALKSEAESLTKQVHLLTFKLDEAETRCRRLEAQRCLRSSSHGLDGTAVLLSTGSPQELVSEVDRLRDAAARETALREEATERLARAQEEHAKELAALAQKLNEAEAQQGALDAQLRVCSRQTPSDSELRWQREALRLREELADSRRAWRVTDSRAQMRRDRDLRRLGLDARALEAGVTKGDLVASMLDICRELRLGEMGHSLRRPFSRVVLGLGGNVAEVGPAVARLCRMAEALPALHSFTAGALDALAPLAAPKAAMNGERSHESAGINEGESSKASELTPRSAHNVVAAKSAEAALDDALASASGALSPVEALSLLRQICVDVKTGRQRESEANPMMGAGNLSAEAAWRDLAGELGLDLGADGVDSVGVAARGACLRRTAELRVASTVCEGLVAQMRCSSPKDLPQAVASMLRLCDERVAAQRIVDALRKLLCVSGLAEVLPALRQVLDVSALRRLQNRTDALGT